MALPENELREREVVALEEIGSALRLIGAALGHRAKIAQAWFDKKNPVKGEVRDVQVTHIQTEEERLRQSQGDTGESDEEWVGSREARFVKAGRP